jgi:uncharacterized cupredoxin-like copper-binding protein
LEHVLIEKVGQLFLKMNPEMEHHDPNATRVPPKKTDEIVWNFTKSGDFEFACLIPGHRDAGMFILQQSIDWQIRSRAHDWLP